MNNMITLQMHPHISNFQMPLQSKKSTVGCLNKTMFSNRHCQIPLKWVQMICLCWIHISPFNFDKISLFSHITKCYKKCCSIPSCEPTIIYYKTFREWQPTWPTEIRKCEHFTWFKLIIENLKVLWKRKNSVVYSWVNKNSKHIS